MRLSKIQKQPFVFRRHRLVTPMPRFCFMTNIFAENGERVAIFVIAVDHLPTRVAAGEKNCKGQRDSAPKVDTRQCSSRSHRPVGGLVAYRTFRRTAHKAAATTVRRDLGGEQQTKRRNHRENSVHALRWD